MPAEYPRYWTWSSVSDDGEDLYLSYQIEAQTPQRNILINDFVPIELMALLEVIEDLHQRGFSESDIFAFVVA